MEEDSLLNLKKGEKASAITTILTVLLAVGKGFAGVLSGSLVLITDALHSGVDILPIFASWFGLKISQREPDEKFPYGYYKAESITTLFVALFILYAGTQFIREGFSKLFVPPSISYPLIAGTAAAISIVISFFISIYQKRIGEEINSQSLLANSKESLLDVLSSFVVLLAILLSYYEVRYVEGAITIFIAILIVKIGFETIKDSVLSLMDAGPEGGIEKKVIGAIESISGVEDFENLKLRKVGPFVFGEVDLKIRKYVDVDRAHEISDRLEKKVKKEVERLDSFTIHIEPYRTEKLRICVPVDEDKGLNSEISEHFGRANYYAFFALNKESGEIKDLEIQENKFKDKEIRAGLSASDFMADQRIDSLVTKEMGEISFHTLRDNLIDIYKIEGGDLSEIADSILKGEIKRLEEPTRDKK